MEETVIHDNVLLYHYPNKSIDYNIWDFRCLEENTEVSIRTMDNKTRQSVTLIH